MRRSRFSQIARFDALGLQKAAFTYSAFDKPTFLSTDGALHWSTFVYDENRDILVRRDSSMGAPSNGRTYFVEGIFEESIDPQGALERRHFVRGGDRTIAVVSDQGEGTALKTRYLHRDHLGSIDTITDETGSVVEELSYDAFGKRRNADWTPSVTRIMSSLTKGYTGHESLDHLGLVHMGGRVYDPELGRFISADPFVQFPDSTQGLNRYAYVNNNPLTFVDPSGFGLSRFFKSVGKFFGKLLGAIGKVTKVINFIKSLACIASFGVGCLLAILQSAISVAFEFGLAPKTRFNTGRTGRLINGIGAALSAGGASQGAQKVTGIGGEVDIGVGMPSVFDQWTSSMRPGGTIVNFENGPAGGTAESTPEPNIVDIIIRSFAPFDSFGGGFKGDGEGRGFSSDPVGPTARINARIRINADNKTVIASFVRSDPSECSTNLSVCGLVTLLTGRSVAVGDPTLSVTTTAKGFDIKLAGANSLVPGSPDIDLRLQLSLGKDGSLSGVLSGDAFPNAEVLIGRPGSVPEFAIRFQTESGPFGGPFIDLFFENERPMGRF